jgi:iron complex transport system permease protein
LLQPKTMRHSSGTMSVWFILVLGLIGLVLTMTTSVSLGAVDIGFAEVWQAILHYNEALPDNRIIMELRIPRALVGAIVGASLAVSGSIMQGITRNPIASPGLLGLNAGSTLALAMAFAFLPGMPYSTLILWSFAGAALSVVVTYGISSWSGAGLTPLRLALAGTAVNALFGSLATGIAIRFKVAQDLSFWYAGSIVGTNWTNVTVMLPFTAIGLAAALLLSRSITVLGLGEATAASLGQKIWLIRIASAICVLILAGSAVSAAGPIGFVGLIIPHITRFLVGVDYRRIIPCSAVLGALFLELADIGARIVNAPFETPVGVITAIVGVPFFLYLVRGDRRGLQ